MPRSRRWLPWVVVALTLLLTGALHRSFQLDTAVGADTAGQAGCTLGPDRRGAKTVPTDGGARPEGTAELTIVAPSPAPEPLPRLEPDDDDDPDGVIPVMRSVAELPIAAPASIGPGTLLLGATEAGAHHVLAWQEGALPTRVIPSPEPVVDLLWRGTQVTTAGSGETPIVRTWRSGESWTEGPSLDGAWMLHRVAGAILATGAGGARVAGKTGWTSLPVGGPVAAAGRAISFGGPRGSPVLIGVDSSEGARLLGCSTATLQCRESWTLGPGSGCGLQGPVAAAALRLHLGHLIAHPLRAGIPQGPERRDRIATCPVWLDHPVLGALSLSADGPLGVATPPQRVTLYDTRGRGEPDLFMVRDHTLSRFVPGVDDAPQPVVQFRPSVTLTTVRPGP